MLFFKRKNSFKQSFKRFFGPIERLENREQPGSLFGVDAMFSPMITSLLDVPTEPISDTTIVNSPVAQPEFLDTSLEAQNSTQAVSSITEFTIISDTSTVSSDAQVDAGFTTLSNESGTGVDVSADPFAAIFAASVFGATGLAGVSITPSIDSNSGATGNTVTPISDLEGLTLPTLNTAGLDGAPESSADSLFAAINGAGLVAGMDNASTPILDGGSSSGGDGAGNQGSSTATINFPTPVLNPLNPIIEMNPLMPLPPGAGDLVGVNIAGIGQNPVAPANPVQNNNNPVVNNQANPVNPDVQLDGGIGNGGALLGVGLLGSDSNSGDYGMGGVGVGLPSQNIANGVLPNGAVDPQVIAGAVGAGQIAAAGGNFAEILGQIAIPGASPTGGLLYNPPANLSSLSAGAANGTPTVVTTLQPGQEPPVTVNAPLGTIYDLKFFNPEAAQYNPANGSTMLQAIQNGNLPLAYIYDEHDLNVSPANDGNDQTGYPNQNYPIVYNQMSRLNGRIVNDIDADWIKFTLTEAAGVFIQLNTVDIAGGLVGPNGEIPTLQLYKALPPKGPAGNEEAEESPIAVAQNSYIVSDLDQNGNLVVNYPIPNRVTQGNHAINGAKTSDSEIQPFVTVNVTTAAGGNNVSSPYPFIYQDLDIGTYFVNLNVPQTPQLRNQFVGNWQLDFFADTGYRASVQDYNSQPGATNNLVIDYDGDTGLGFAPYQIGGGFGSTSNFSPIEQIAIYNTFRIVQDDFSPFNVNVTTNSTKYRPGTSDFRVFVTSSGISVVGTNDLGAVITPDQGVVSQANFSRYGDNGTGLSTDPTAIALEIGNSISNVVGVALGCDTSGYSFVAPNSLRLNRTADYTLSNNSLVNFTPSGGLLEVVQSTGTITVNQPSGLVNAMYAGVADDRIMSNAADIFSTFDPQYPRETGFLSDAGFSRELWRESDYQVLVSRFGARIADNNDSKFSAQLLNYDSSLGRYFVEGVAASNQDPDWYRFTSFGGSTRIIVNVDEYAGNAELVFDIWAYDPDFYRPQRIVGYSTYRINTGTFDIDVPVNLPTEREYYLQIGTAFAVGPEAAIFDPTGGVNNGVPVENVLPCGHYQLSIITQY